MFITGPTLVRWLSTKLEIVRERDRESETERNRDKEKEIIPKQCSDILGVHDGFFFTHNWTTFSSSFPLSTGNCSPQWHNSLDRFYHFLCHQGSPWRREVVHAWAWDRAQEKQHLGPRTSQCSDSHLASLRGQQDHCFHPESARPVLGDIRWTGGSLVPL